MPTPTTSPLQQPESLPNYEKRYSKTEERHYYYSLRTKQSKWTIKNPISLNYLKINNKNQTFYDWNKFIKDIHNCDDSDDLSDRFVRDQIIAVVRNCETFISKFTESKNGQSMTENGPINESQVKDFKNNDKYEPTPTKRRPSSGSKIRPKKSPKDPRQNECDSGHYDQNLNDSRNKMSSGGAKPFCFDRSGPVSKVRNEAQNTSQNIDPYQKMQENIKDLNLDSKAILKMDRQASSSTTTTKNQVKRKLSYNSESSNEAMRDKIVCSEGRSRKYVPDIYEKPGLKKLTQKLEHSTDSNSSYNPDLSKIKQRKRDRNYERKTSRDTKHQSQKMSHYQKSKSPPNNEIFSPQKYNFERTKPDPDCFITNNRSMSPKSPIMSPRSPVMASYGMSLKREKTVNRPIVIDDCYE